MRAQYAIQSKDVVHVVKTPEQQVQSQFLGSGPHPQN
jgi:hypothetical protein